jgi:hypothetical protein
MDEQEDLIERLTRFYRVARNEVPSTPPPWTPRERRTVRWLQPVLASAAIVAVAAGLAVTLRLVRDHATRATIAATPTVSVVPSTSPTASASPSPSPSVGANWVTRNVPVGDVTAMSLDSAAIFALYAPTPASSGIDASQIRLARIDRATGGVITAGPFPNATHLTAVAAGIWIAAGVEQGTNTDTQWMTLVDPVTLTVKQRVHLPGQPDPAMVIQPQLAGTSTLLWLGYGHSLYRLDPNTAQVLATQSLPGVATSISIDPAGQRLYVGIEVTGNQPGQDLVIESDVSTGARLASAPTGGRSLGGPEVAAASDGVWIAYATGTRGQIEHRSATTLAILTPAGGTYSNGIHVFVGAGALWLVDAMAQGLACAVLATGTVAASSQETLPAALVADANGSYLGEADGVAFLQPPSSCPH